MSCLALAIMEQNVNSELRDLVDDDVCNLPTLKEGPFTFIAYTFCRLAADQDSHTPALRPLLERFGFRAHHYNVTLSKTVLLSTP